MEFSNNLKKAKQGIMTGVMLLKFTRHDHWSRERLVSYQHKRLLSLVSYAVSRSSFYRELYKGIKISKDLELGSLPVINKTMMMDDFDRFVTDPRIKLKELKSHIRQLSGDEQYLGEYRVITTSGSTGQKGIYVFNMREWAASIATGGRGLLVSGVLPSITARLKESKIYPQNPMHMSYRMAVGSISGLKNAQLLNIASSIESIVSALNAFQPEVLTTYPSMASLLAIEQIEGRLDIQPKIINTAAEMRTEEMEMNIRKAWDADLFNMYGSTEMGGNHECSFHRGIHMFDDYSLIEVVDEKNQPVPDGTPGFKLLITNLFDYTQPLIRYEISDMVTMSTETCPCGRPFKMLSDIEGRNNDLIYLPNDKGQDVLIHSIHFFNALGVVKEVAEYQVLQEKDRIVIRVVLRKDASEDGVADEIKDNLQKSFETLGVSYSNIHVCFADRLKRDPNKMGKLKIIQSNVERG